MPDHARYLSIVEPPPAYTRLVIMRPLLALDDDDDRARPIHPAQLEADFPNVGRVTWSQHVVEPPTGSLWWHRVQANAGFIPGLRGSNQWLVDESSSMARPKEAIELLDLCALFARDDRQLRTALFTEGIALPWTPTRQVYLCLDAPERWIGPLELRPAPAGDDRWRITVTGPVSESMSLPCRTLPSSATQLQVTVDGHHRHFLRPDTPLDDALSDWLWPTDRAVFGWLAEELEAAGPLDGHGLAERTRDILVRLSDRPDGSPLSNRWLWWAERAIARLDSADAVLHGLVGQLLQTTAVRDLLPPPPDPDALTRAREEGCKAGYRQGFHEGRQEAHAAGYGEGQQAAKAEAAREASDIAERHQREVADLSDTVEQLRTDLASTEKALAEAQTVLADAQALLAEAQTALDDAHAATDAESTAHTGTKEQLAALQAELDAAQQLLNVQADQPSADRELLEQACAREAEVRKELAQAVQDANKIRPERDRLEKLLKDARNGETQLQATINGLRAEISERKKAAQEADDPHDDDDAAAREPVLEQVRSELSELHEQIADLLDAVTTIAAVEAPPPVPTSDIPAWRAPWADNPPPQSLVATSVTTELRRALVGAQLPGNLAPMLWATLQANRLPVLAGHGGRAALTIIASICFGGRRLPLEIDPGLLAPADLLGTLSDGRLRPAAGRLADLLLAQASAERNAEPLDVPPVLIALHGLTRAPVDAYLQPLLAHYARPSWSGTLTDPLGGLLPSTLDASDPYAQLAGLAWPRSVRIAATIEPGTTAVPPPADLWAHAAFLCLEHAASKQRAALVPALAQAAVAELERDSERGPDAPPAVRPALSPSLRHFSPSVTNVTPEDAARTFSKARQTLGHVGAHLPESVQQAGIVLVARGYKTFDVLGSLLLPWAITAGASHDELAALLTPEEDDDADDDDTVSQRQRLAACLGCMEELLR